MRTTWMHNPRARAAHLYVSGAGTGDGSLCGVPLAPGHTEQQYANDRQCARCARAKSTFV